MRRLALISLLLVCVLAAAPGPADALVPRQVFGIGNVGDPAAAFADPALHALQPRATRLIAEWDVARTPGHERDRVDAWYSQAVAAHLEPLLAFQAFQQRRAPSVRRYRRATRAAIARWPLVAQWQAFNEANHVTQPTHRRPVRAARYARALERTCPECTVLPVTVQLGTSRHFDRWIARFLRAYGRTPRIWAVHGYSDANRSTYARLRDFLRAQDRGRIWITETGALAKFATTFPYDLDRQRRMTRYVFRAGLRFRRRVDRLYWWQWRGAEQPRRVRWDSGLLDAWGRPRPAYRAALRARFERP